MSEQYHPPTEHQLYPYSVKIEKDYKRSQTTVHCYLNDKQIALNEAVQMYDEAEKKSQEQGLTVTSIERHSTERIE